MLFIRMYNLSRISNHSSNTILLQRIQNISLSLLPRSVYTLKDLEKTEKIYEGPLYMKVRVLKMISMASSIGALPLQYLLFDNYRITDNVFSVIFCGVLAVFQVASPLLIHYIGSKYVATMHYDAKKDRYIAMTYNLFAMEKYTDFIPDDVKCPKMEIFACAMIKNKSMFFDPEHFTNIEHYKRILGYDKPMNLFDDLEHKKENVKK